MYFILERHCFACGVQMRKQPKDSNTKAIRLSFRVNASEMHEILKHAHVHERGKLSEFLRRAALMQYRKAVK